MIENLKKLEHLIGRTPLMKLSQGRCNLFVKLEYHNYSGSIKDRAAYNIIEAAIKRGQITEATRIVESSSGNFAISLAMICKQIGLHFTAIIDPNINSEYEKILRLLTDRVVKVEERDHTGGYLLNRIARVKQICESESNCFWPNQYENPDNYRAYYSLGYEIGHELELLDYAFVGVSSGGTITGLSMSLKEYFPKIKIVAVDVEGSVIFGKPPKKRNISGIGSSQKPEHINLAMIDDVVHVSEQDIVQACYNLINDHAIFAGASSGASFAAISSYLTTGTIKQCDNVLFLCPDKGSGYLDTVYNPSWFLTLSASPLVDGTI